MKINVVNLVISALCYSILAAAYPIPNNNEISNDRYIRRRSAIAERRHPRSEQKLIKRIPMAPPPPMPPKARRRFQELESSNLERRYEEYHASPSFVNEYDTQLIPRS